MEHFKLMKGFLFLSFKASAEIEVACFIGVDNLEEVIGDFTENFRWENSSEVVKKCTKLAHAKNYKLFALGKNGLCLSGPNTDHRYYISGTFGAECRNGIGIGNSIFVYALGMYKKQRSFSYAFFFLAWRSFELLKRK